MKRYINGIRRPFVPKGRYRFVLVLVISFLLLFIVRLFFLTQVEVQYDRGDLNLLQGDRVIVNRLSYGLRVPWSESLGYSRWGKCNPSVGEIVVYDYPDGSGRISLDRVIGVPGDTLWLEDDPKSFTVVPQASFCVGGIIVPEERIIGCPIAVSYSVDERQPFYRMMRPNRVFIEIE